MLFLIFSTLADINAQLPKEYYDFLLALKKNLVKLMKPIGNIDYADYRKYLRENIEKDYANFIDGDVIETFLDLSPELMQQCIEGLNVSFGAID